MRLSSWTAALGPAAGVVALFVAVVLSEATRHGGRTVPVVWLGNALLLGLLLRSPRRQWIVYFAAFVVCEVVGGVWVGAPPMMIAGLTVCDIASVAVALLVVGVDEEWISGRAERIRAWVRFLVGCLVVAPALSGLLILAVIASVTPLDPAEAVRALQLAILGDAVAYALVTPLVLRVTAATLRARPVHGRYLELVLLVGVQAAVTSILMAQTHFVPLILTSLPMAPLWFRHGYPGVVLGSAVTGAAIIAFTSVGYGPMAADIDAVGDPQHALLWAEVYVVALAVMVHLGSAVQADRKRLNDEQAVNAQVHRLIAENSTDMIVVTDATGAAVYASESVNAWLGKPPGSTVHQSDWVTHPQDTEAAEEYRARLRAGPDVQLVGVARARHTSGEWRYVESRSSVVMTSHDRTDALVVSFLRDVTEQLARQDELIRLNLELETAASTDALTGLPNRRRLAEVRREAWRAVTENGGLLSMLVVDIDLFKAYNDHNGHDRGDACLVAVACELSAVLVAARGDEGDVLARFGGEEFVVVLPGADAAGAVAVAEAMRAAVRKLAIPHAESPFSTVTISVGVATTGPGITSDSTLFAGADSALYRAKRLGRNRVVSHVAVRVTPAAPDSS